MRVMGVPAIAGAIVSDALSESTFNGRVAFVWCDGQDVTGVFGDEGDTQDDLMRIVVKVVPELAQ